MRRFLACLSLAAALPTFAAEPARIERDLGQGLAYVRVHELPADLPTAPARPRPLVLDLRYATGDVSAARALAAWIQFRASVRTPILVLVNPSTADDLLAQLEASASTPGLMSIGVASSRYVPDIALKVPAATERAAYDALENGTPAAKLLSDTPEKTRRDEASIAQERAQAATTEDSDSTAGDSEAAAAAAPPAPPPLIDAALQRAVQVHRALKALKKI